MAIDQEGGSGHEAGRHGRFPGIELDEDETLPGGTITLGFGFELVKEGLLELEDFLHVHTDDEGLGGSGEGVSENNVFEFISAGRKDGSAFVDFGGIEEIEDGKMLDRKDFIHAFDAEAAFTIEEVGNVGLFESGLLGKAESGELTCFDAVPEDFAEIILQDFELHGPEYSTGL